MSVTNQVKIYTFLEKFYLSDIRRNRTPENIYLLKHLDLKMEEDKTLPQLILLGYNKCNKKSDMDITRKEMYSPNSTMT